MLLAKGANLEHDNKVGRLGLRDSVKPGRHGGAGLRGSLQGAKHMRWGLVMTCRTAGQLFSLQHGMAQRR